MIRTLSLKQREAQRALITAIFGVAPFPRGEEDQAAELEWFFNKKRPPRSSIEHTRYARTRAAVQGAKDLARRIVSGKNVSAFDTTRISHRLDRASEPGVELEISQAASLLGVSSSKIYEWIADDVLGSGKKPATVSLPLSAIRTFFDEHQETCSEGISDDDLIASATAKIASGDTLPPLEKVAPPDDACPLFGERHLKGDPFDHTDRLSNNGLEPGTWIMDHGRPSPVKAKGEVTVDELAHLLMTSSRLVREQLKIHGHPCALRDGVPESWFRTASGQAFWAFFLPQNAPHNRYYSRFDRRCARRLDGRRL